MPKMSLPMYSLYHNIIKNFCQVLQISQLLFGRDFRPDFRRNGEKDEISWGSGLFSAVLVTFFRALYLYAPWKSW